MPTGTVTAANVKIAMVGQVVPAKRSVEEAHVGTVTAVSAHLTWL